MSEHRPRPGDSPQIGDDLDPSELASVVFVERREDVATICGRLDTAPTFAVVVHAPDGNRSLSTELGMRRLQRHADEAGKVLAVATRSSALATRARQLGIPAARRPENVRWDAGGRRVLGFGRRTMVLPALGRYLQVLAIALFFLLFVAILLTLAPSGEIVATPPIETLSEAVTITADPDAEDIDLETMTVPATKVASTQLVTLAVRTTGRASVGTLPAKVVITFTNPGSSEFVVPRGAVVVVEPSKLRYQVDLDTRVPPGQPAAQQATALTPGVEGNVPAGSVWTWAEERYRTLAIANARAGAGGASEERQAVSEADVLAINNLARDLERSDAVKRLLLAARPHDAVFLRTAEADVQSSTLSAEVATPTDILLMEVRITVSATAVLSTTLDEIAQQALRRGEGVGEFILGSVVALETGASEIDEESGTIKTRLEIRGDFARGLTRDAIKDAVKGKSESEARSTLQTRYGIEQAEVSVSPGWAPWLPRFDFRIDVRLRSPAAEVTPPAEATPTNAQPGTSPTPTPRP